MDSSHPEYLSDDIVIDSTLESQLQTADPPEETGCTESENGSQSLPIVDERYQAV